MNRLDGNFPTYGDSFTFSSIYKCSSRSKYQHIWEEKYHEPNGGGSVLSGAMITHSSLQSLRLEPFSSFDFKRGMIHFSTALTIGLSDPSLHSLLGWNFPETDTIPSSKI